MYFKTFVSKNMINKKNIFTNEHEKEIFLQNALKYDEILQKSKNFL